MKKPVRMLDEETNPCVKEHKLVDRCLIREDYDPEKCEAFFENYRQCKWFWNKVRLERIVKQIKPSMPGKVEREQIMKERQAKMAS